MIFFHKGLFDIKNWGIMSMVLLNKVCAAGRGPGKMSIALLNKVCAAAQGGQEKMSMALLNREWAEAQELKV